MGREQERALFAGTPTSMPAGKDAMSAPAVVPDRLYKLRLVAQKKVAFPVSPGRKPRLRRRLPGLRR